MALSLKQQLFVNEFRSGKHRFMLFGGGIGSGKTILTLGLLHEVAMQYPGVRLGVARKELTVIRRNTIASFKKVLKLNVDQDKAFLQKGDHTFYYNNGSEIIFFEANLGKDPELNKMRGLELTMILLEEANEMDEKVFSTAIQRTGRWENKEQGIPPIILLTCNPTQGWLKRLFYDKWKDGTIEAPFYFLQALPHDNPFHDKAYLESLEFLPEAEYERFVKGNWEYAGDPNQLISFIALKEATIGAEQLLHRVPRYIGIDVAREGNDKTIFCFGDDVGALFFTKHENKKGHQIAHIMKDEQDTYGILDEDFIVDEIGVGGGTIDACETIRLYPSSFKSSESPEKSESKYHFANKRAQAYWYLKEDIESGSVTVFFDKELQNQLLAVRYKVEDRGIIIEPKKDLKNRLGSSPDEMDALVMFNYRRRMYNQGFSRSLEQIEKMYIDSRYDKDTMLDEYKTAMEGLVY